MELSRISKPKLDSITESFGDDELNEEEEEEEEVGECNNIIGQMKERNCDINISYSSHCITAQSLVVSSQDFKRKSSFSRSAADVKANRRLDRLKYSLQPVSPRPVRPLLQSGAACVFDFDSQ